MLGESRVQKRNRGCWGKSAGEMQMLGGKEILRRAGCWGKGASEENTGCEEEMRALGKGNQGGRGLPGLQGIGEGQAPPCPRGNLWAPSLVVPARPWRGRRETGVPPGGGVSVSGGRGRSAYGGAARCAASEREEEVGEGFRGRGAAEPAGSRRLHHSAPLRAPQGAVRQATPGCQCLQGDVPQGHDPLGRGEAPRRPWLLLPGSSGGGAAASVEWFRDVYGDVVQTVRVEATEDTRKRRNWVFVTGVDDAESECGLDQGVAFDWVITNDGDKVALDEQLEMLLQSLHRSV